MHKQNSFMTSQSETSCLKFRMLHALYNLPARKNSTVTFYTIMSRAYELCLARQHFISNYCFWFVM